MFLCATKITWLLESLYQSTNNHNNIGKIDIDVVRIFERIEQATKRGNIEVSAKDCRTIMRDESKDDSNDGKL